jgi:hypothetical protein
LKKKKKKGAPFLAGFLREKWGFLIPGADVRVALAFGMAQRFTAAVSSPE